MEKEIKKTSFKIKVTERAGDSIKSMLQKSNPFPTRKCSDPQCMVCSTGGKGNCRTNNVTYKIVCNICGDVYYGETCRNCYSRGIEHTTDLNKKTENSVLHRHMRDKHSDTDTPVTPDFTMSVIGTHKTAMDRQIAEAVLINTGGSKLINRKSEWGHTKVVSCTPVAE